MGRSPIGSLLSALSVGQAALLWATLRQLPGQLASATPFKRLAALLKYRGKIIQIGLDEEERDYVHHIENSVRKLQALIDDMHSLSCVAR